MCNYLIVIVFLITEKLLVSIYLIEFNTYLNILLYTFFATKQTKEFKNIVLASSESFSFSETWLPWQGFSIDLKLKQGVLSVFLPACAACMNMGTLTGAPKVRAMQLIAEYEQERRGSYGGAIGYFTDSGNLDTCITIRSAYIEKEIATIQAGAGVVFNSIPNDEVNESVNKAQAVINAIKKAHRI